MIEKYTLILLLRDGSEKVIDEVFKSKEEVKNLVNDYYSVRMVRSNSGYFEAIVGYTITQGIESKVFKGGKNR